MMAIAVTVTEGLKQQEMNYNASLIPQLYTTDRN